MDPGGVDWVASNLPSLRSFVDPGGGGVNWVASHLPSLRSFKLNIKKENKTITEAILSRIVPISFCQISHHKLL